MNINHLAERLEYNHCCFLRAGRDSRSKIEALCLLSKQNFLTKKEGKSTPSNKAKT